MLRRDLIDGVLAGFLVSIGGAVLLSCDNRYAGAFLFCIALLTICWFGFNLYTGKVGFLPEKHGKEEWSVLLLGLLGNLLGTVAGGYLMRFGLPKLGEAAEALCAAKLTQPLYQTFVRGLFCGILMYLAVSIFRDQKTIVGILFCIPVFILSGFEHSIADMFYFAAAGSFSLRGVVFIALVVLGNSVGGMLLPALGMIGKEA